MFVYFQIASMTYFVEKEGSQWTFLDSFWYSLMTLTTVGYELQPQSTSGKVRDDRRDLMIKTELSAGWWSVCSPWNIHPDSPTSHCGKQLLYNIQEQVRQEPGAPLLFVTNILTPGCGGMRWPPRKPRSWSQLAGLTVSMTNTSGGNCQASPMTERKRERSFSLLYEIINSNIIS